MAPPRQRIIAFVAGSGSAAVLAMQMKMQIWKETAQASANRISPPPNAEKEKPIDGILSGSQRRYLIRSWNAGVDWAFAPIVKILSDKGW